MSASLAPLLQETVETLPVEVWMPNDKIRAACRAIVIVPARNEEATLCATLDALRDQRDESGQALDFDLYEVLLLLNNCTDNSVRVATEYQQRFPKFRFFFRACVLAPEIAHVGTARRMLMDHACTRLEINGKRSAAPAHVILSTDADTIVAHDWIAQNLKAIDAGAEVVGGVIRLFPKDFAALDDGTRMAYERDRELQSLVARLESLLDPDAADPWPRHLENFGASLACTCEAYRRCGGLPAVKPLEDVAFVTALRRAGARIRHAPEVGIQTSARLDGRAEVGLSGQLRHWRQETAARIPHLVDSAEWLEFRFRTIASLRKQNTAVPTDAVDPLHEFPEPFASRIEGVRRLRLATPEFLEQLDYNALLEEMFETRSSTLRRAEIGEVIVKLRIAIRSLTGIDSPGGPSAP